MSLQENMAAFIRAVMDSKHMSLTEFSEEIGISRNSLHNYLKCRGNPSFSTAEHIAQSLGVDPASLILGMSELGQREIVLQLLGTIRGLAELPEEKRLRVAELFLEMMKQWDKE